MELEDKVAAVTGAAGGIGLATARALSAKGALVALLDLDAERVTREAARLPIGSAHPCDVRDAGSVERAMADVRAGLGPIDILVNNAGVWRRTPLLPADEGDWDLVYETNVKGIMLCSAAVAPTMIQRRSGKIVNVSSLSGFMGYPGWGAYGASKAAAISLTLAHAIELEPHNVQVHVVCPAATDTPMADFIRATEPVAEPSLLAPPEDVAAEVIKLVTPFDDNATGIVVPMGPIESVLGIPIR